MPNITENIKVAAGFNITALVIDKDGNLLHLGLPPAIKYNLGSEFNQALVTGQKAAMPEEKVEHNGETHAFIAKNCSFGEDPDCQLILIHPKTGKESRHATLTQTLHKWPDKLTDDVNALKLPKNEEETE